MAKHKIHDRKDKKKASQLVIRLEKAERDAFVSLCDRLDTSAAREIRRFMREFVSANAARDLEADVQSEPTVIEQVPDVAAADGAVEPEVTIAAEPETSVEGAVAGADKPKKPNKKSKGA